jgi:hypothetical protein
MILWLSAIALVALAIMGGYFGYGMTGALTVIGVICVILFAIWIDRTA